MLDCVVDKALWLGKTMTNGEFHAAPQQRQRAKITMYHALTEDRKQQQVRACLWNRGHSQRVQ